MSARGDEGWDDRGCFVVELSVREFYTLQRAQLRNGESLEDTLLRLAGIREEPLRQAPVANDDRARMGEAAHRLSLSEARAARGGKL